MKKALITLLKVIVLGVALPLCTWKGYCLLGSFSSQKPSHSPTSTMTSLFDEKRAETKDSEKKALLEGVQEKESQDLFRIAEEDKAMIVNENGVDNTQYRDCNWAQCWIDELNDLIEAAIR